MINLKQVLAVINNNSDLMDPQETGKMWGLYKTLKADNEPTESQIEVWETVLNKEQAKRNAPSSISEVASKAVASFEAQKEVALGKHATTKAQEDIDDIFDTLAIQQEALEALAQENVTLRGEVDELHETVSLIMDAVQAS